MRFSDLQRLFNTETIELICPNHSFYEGKLIQIRKHFDSNDAEIYSLADADGDPVKNGVPAQFVTKRYAEKWALIQEAPYFASIISITKNRLTVSAITGFTLFDMKQTLDIAITDTALSKGQTLSEYRENYSIRLGNDKYIIVAKHMQQKQNTISLVNGLSIIHAVEMSKKDCGLSDPLAAGSEKIFVVRTGAAPFRKDSYSLELWNCELNICDARSAHQASIGIKAMLNQNLEKYLTIWREYSKIEYEFVQHTAENAGELQYSLIDDSHDGQEVVVKIENPEYIQVFQEGLNDLGSDRVVSVTRRSYGISNPLTAVLRKIDSEEKTARLWFHTIEKASQIATEGTIGPNIRAATVQFERREDAFKRVFESRSAKPQLAMLISGQDITKKQHKRKITPLSEHVLRQFGKNTPTEAQLEAIRIALNTPDFAIIQGPPGTGKSTVIKAILTALSDKEKDPDLFFGSNLVTAYQKDATDHLAEKLEIYGLPVITFKGQSSYETDEERERDNDLAVSEWIENKYKEIAESERHIRSFADIDMMAARLRLINMGFDVEKATRELCRSKVLAYINEIQPFSEDDTDDRVWNGSLFFCKARKLLSELEIELEGDGLTEAGLVIDRQYARNIPTSGISMEDDGKQIVIQAIQHFSNERFSDTVHELVSMLKKLFAEEPVNYERVKIVKTRLLVELRNRSGLLSNQKINQKVKDLFNETIRSIAVTSRNDEEVILADYLRAFSDESVIKEAVTQFMTVISATHQKSTSFDVFSRKDTTADSVVFKNVLIDEAARSCPPDLLIPLSCAQDRMILVGDHKQLPQFVSDKVYDAIDRIPSEDKRSVIKDKPMFLHMIEQVKKLEAKDGIKRFIQLDAQHRMPKTLGDLISSQFYSDGVSLKSPLGNDPVYFGNSLKYISGLHLAWLDVRGGVGKREDQNKNGSYVRLAEAERVVKMLKHIIKDSGPEAANYKYGIMTFYNGQKELIRDLIRAEDDWKSWPINIDTDIGSVDAFQGLERDIIILSLVRSNTDYKNAKKRYGFTTDEHRLCVALSRAKRCMIIAGDSNMVRGKKAAHAVPALKAFYDLCTNEEITDARVFQDKEFSHTEGE